MLVKTNGVRIMTLGPLAIRIVVGVIFIVNGWQKLIFLQQTQRYFMMIGLPVETAILIGLLEVIRGVLLIVGLLTRVTVILFAISISFVLTGPGRLSIEWNILKCELIPNGRKMAPRLGQQ